jgi:outer membrane protein TolC
MRHGFVFRFMCFCSLTLLLAGCGSVSKDAGFSKIKSATKEHLAQDLVWQRSSSSRSAVKERVDEILRQPLTKDAAVQIALLNHPGLQARFFDLGIAEAELVQASRLSNPSLSLARLKGGDGLEIERGLQFNILQLLTLSTTRKLALNQQRRVRLEVEQEVLRVAANASLAYYEAVAANANAEYAQQVVDAAAVSAELVQRMKKAGNISALRLAQEQLFFENAKLDLTRALQAQVTAREQLIRAMGLSHSVDALQLPAHLPPLPDQLLQPAAAEKFALDQRLDVRIASMEAQRLAAQLGLTRSTRWVNVLELGGVRKSQPGSTQNGVEITLELPIFDSGSARLAEAEARYKQALFVVADIAQQAQSEVRENLAQLRSSYTIARQYQDQILPLRKRIADENVLRYNGMQVSVFELLEDAHAQINAVQSAMQATRDFWMAQARVEMVLFGRLPGDAR